MATVARSGRAGPRNDFFFTFCVSNQCCLADNAPGTGFMMDGRQSFLNVLERLDQNSELGCSPHVIHSELLPCRFTTLHRDLADTVSVAQVLVCIMIIMSIYRLGPSCGWQNKRNND